MTITEPKWAALPVPFAVEDPDRIPKERYYDPEFFELEKKMFWPRVWQMACRLEEIPNPGDYAEYQILDQSIVVVRGEDMQVGAYYNVCRHRGVKLVKGHGSSLSGFTCPFHGWCYGLDGSNTFVYRPNLYAEHNRVPGELDLVPVRCELWGGCAWVNMDDHAPPLRQTIEPFATAQDAMKCESLRTEWWMACRLPTNWKLAMEAFMEGWHVMETHPQLVPPGTREQIRQDYTVETGGASRVAGFDRHVKKVSTSGELVDAFIGSMWVLNEGMGGMIHENDIRVAESLRGIELPDDPAEARKAWRTALNDAVVKWHRGNGSDVPDLNEVERSGLESRFCFPHYFLLPQFSSAASYRVRPLGPEETLFEIYSLTRYPAGQEPPRPTPPEALAPDDPRWPLISAQDFSNLPRQQEGLHSNGFAYMRLSDQMEGMISNLERLVDGYLAGLPDEKLLPAIRKTNTVIDVPIADFDF